MTKESKFRLRFWFWHQEVVIDDITADELVTSAFFPYELDLEEHPSFSRTIYLKDVYNKRFNSDFYNDHKIEVTFDEEGNLQNLLIGHLKPGSDENIDTRYGENGWSIVGPDNWILERIN